MTNPAPETNVVPIDPEMLDVLRELLAQVERGEIDGVAIAWTLPAGGSHNYCIHYPHSHPITLLGEVTCMQAALVRRFSQLSQRDELDA